MLEINPRIQVPGNETEKHFLLKQVAVSVLKTRFSSQFAGKEVEIGLCYNKNYREQYPDFNWKKVIADAVGIQRKYQPMKRDYEFIVRNIEVKVSKSDLKNGYCTSADYNYIMSPKGLFTKNDILPFMGLIEVDLDELKWKNGIQPIDGINIVSNSTRMHTNRKNRKAWIELVRDKMLKTYTNEAAFRGLWFYPGFNYKKIN